MTFKPFTCASAQRREEDGMKLPGNRPKKKTRANHHAHGLEHVLAGIIRKYGSENGRSLVLDAETLAEPFQIRFSLRGRAVVVEVKDHDCPDCIAGRPRVTDPDRFTFDQFVAAAVRKYGDNNEGGKSMVLEEETLAGNHTIRLNRDIDGGVVAELIDPREVAR
jgi:hypothetical protein